MEPIITLNVTGTLFQTYASTLRKSECFKNMFDDTTIDYTQPLFINRSAKIFEHVLAYLIDDHYPYPKKYVYELDYFYPIYNT